MTPQTEQLGLVNLIYKPAKQLYSGGPECSVGLLWIPHHRLGFP